MLRSCNSTIYTTRLAIAGTSTIQTKYDAALWFSEHALNGLVSLDLEMLNTVCLVAVNCTMPPHTHT